MLAISYVIVCVWLIIANSEGQADIIVCPSKLLYNFPCPGCGITRATLKFLHCDIISAFTMNPNVIFSILFIIIYPFLFFVDITIKKGIICRLFSHVEDLLHQKYIWIPFLVIEILIWVHNIRTGI